MAKDIKTLLKRHLRSGRSITGLQALRLFGTIRLAVYIQRLRDEHLSIKTEMIKRGQKTFAKYSLVVMALLLLVSCADSEHVTQCVTDEPYGFWSGLWHGLIVIFSWIGSWFSDDIAIYAVNNNGGWYDFGFVLGLTGIFGALKSSK